MVLKELVDASAACFRSGAFHASFLLALCAADATAKKRFPAKKHVGPRFKGFLRESMPALYGVETFWVAVDMPEDRSTLAVDKFGSPLQRDDDDFYRNAGVPRMILMEGVLYHAFRCALSHEADLPDVQLLPPTPDGAPSVTVDTTVRISANIIDRLLGVVVTAPENAEVFGGGPSDSVLADQPPE
ncbi:MAG: hypothetical protein ACF8R9_12235 [Phycisphaerales bacterium JB054]